MRKQISSIVLAIVLLLAIVQFGPSLLFAQQESPAKACQIHDDRSATGPQGAIDAIVAVFVALTA